MWDRLEREEQTEQNNIRRQAWVSPTCFLYAKKSRWESGGLAALQLACSILGRRVCTRYNAHRSGQNTAPTIRIR